MILPQPGTEPPRVYLNCPRCGLTITPKVDWLAIEHCPRCVARYHTLVSLFASTLPTAELYADGTRPRSAGSDLLGREAAVIATAEARFTKSSS